MHYQECGVWFGPEAIGMQVSKNVTNMVTCHAHDQNQQTTSAKESLLLSFCIWTKIQGFQPEILGDLLQEIHFQGDWMFQMIISLYIYNDYDR